MNSVMARSPTDRKRDPLTGVQQVNRSRSPDLPMGPHSMPRGLSMKLVQFVQSFIREEDGAAAIEYGLIAALIAVAIIAGSSLLGTSLNDLFTRLGNCMATPNVAVCGLVV